MTDVSTSSGETAREVLHQVELGLMPSSQGLLPGLIGLSTRHAS